MFINSKSDKSHILLLTLYDKACQLHGYFICTFIPDYHRESFSRIRLMSHNLKIETGRWSRIPRERRMCHCDNNHLQTEAHVLIDCVLTLNIRLRYPMLNFTDINNLLTEVTYLSQLCKYSHEILEFFN